MKLCESLAINLKYYRKKYNLSQERFAEILGTTLSYLNQIENNKVDVKASTIDKFTNNINTFLPNPASQQKQTLKRVNNTYIHNACFYRKTIRKKCTKNLHPLYLY